MRVRAGEAWTVLYMRACLICMDRLVQALMGEVETHVDPNTLPTAILTPIPYTAYSLGVVCLYG